MANLNLSEFTEKFFVADADHTFIWDTAASISKRVSRNSWLNSGTLTSDAPVTISQTWNGTGSTVFTALKVNATSTASDPTSKLLDLQVGTVSQFSVRKDGRVFGDINSAFSLSGGFFQFYSYGGVSFSAGTNTRVYGALGIGPNGGVGTLVGEVENTLALRNGAAAQTFRVYNTYTDASNYERGEFVWSGSTFYIQTINLGSGQTRPLSFGGQSMAFRTNSGSGLTERMAITAAGNVGIGTTAPAHKLDVVGNGRFVGDYPYVALKPNAWADAFYIQNNLNSTSGAVGVYTVFLNPAAHGFSWYQGSISRMLIDTAGNVGIGTTSPTSKLHVAGSSSPSITVDNTLATGASQLLFKNTVVTGDTDGIFLNGSAQTGFGGNGSLNIKATTGPIAFHTASLTNALSIAQNGTITAGRIILNTLQTATIINANDTKFFWEFSSSLEIATFARLQTSPIMQFAGTTNLFPAIKRSTVRLQARLADDSGFTNIQGKLTTDTDYTATVVTPTGFLTLYDAQGNAYKVPCVAA